MTKAFSVASWNVEHFGATDKNKFPKKPVEQQIEFLAKQKADVIAIFEVRSSIVFRPLVEAMPNYQFHITEGPQTQEILVGIRNGFSGFVTQKLEFKSKQPGLRPGVLVTLRVDQEYYPIIFLHLKSMTDPKGFGLRDEMLKIALRFRRRLDEAAGGTGKANYLFIGDLNTMGMDYPYTQHDISADAEINELKRRARHHSKMMRVLDKTEPYTWWGGSGSKHGPSSLDHVVVADHLEFKNFGGAQIDVRGWPQETTDADKDAWTERYSDHALLYFEVQKV
ncbi:MAG: endonuclease/exonuclease/phosphatase family protein [Candidatus Scalinduaceae bacterium]